ncbi:MAG TPA: hypothetical protein VGC32_21890 [Solirubrobacterales bacterium]
MWTSPVARWMQCNSFSELTWDFEVCSERLTSAWTCRFTSSTVFSILASVAFTRERSISPSAAASVALAK